jgi:AhpD family alkylhydroperoxidase
MPQRIDYRKVSPAALHAMLQLQETVEKSGLEKTLIELVKIRASQVNHCAFCLHMHTKDARKAGISEEKVYLLNAWRESSLYSERERAALAWTEALTLLPEHGAPQELYDYVRTQFSEAEMVSLTLAVVAINGWNRICVGFNVPHPPSAQTIAA